MLIQADPEAIQNTIEHLQRFHLAWLYHSRNVEQSFSDMVLEMFAGDWQTSICNEMGALYPQIACVADELTDYINRFKCLLTRLQDADHCDASPLIIPPPRIYIINGINSDASPGTIDNDAQSIKDYIGDNSFMPDDQIVALTSVYNTNFTTHYDTTFDGTILGSIGVGLGSATNMLTGVFNKGVGAGQVLNENLRGENGPYTQQLYNEVLADISKNPLLPGQKVIIVAHSGGGAIAGNLPGMLEKHDIDVSNVVTLGSPVTGNTESSQFANNLHIFEDDDLIGKPWLHSAIIDSAINGEIIPVTHSVAYAQISANHGPDDHMAYWTNPETINIMSEHIPEIAAYR